MARHGKNLTDDSAAADIDGIRIGFLAEEDAFDRRALWRLASWGIAAVCAVTIGVLANQSYIQVRRDLSGANDLVRQSEQIQTAARENRNELKRLSAAIDTLNADRDRLYARTASLEQGLQSTTGSIARQTANAADAKAPDAKAADAKAADAKAASAKAAAPSSLLATATPDEQNPGPSSPAESPEPAQAVLTVLPTPSQSTGSVSAHPAPSENAKPGSNVPSSTILTASDRAVTATVIAATEIKSAAAAATGPLVQSASESKTEPLGPEPDATGSITAEPQPLAAEVAVPRTLFGVDLGTAPSIDGLRAAWRRLTALHQTELTDLKPIIVLRERKGIAVPQLRLVAGPLDDAAAAAKICATLATSRHGCETATYDGQRLAVTAEPAPTARPPRRHVTPKHAHRETPANRSTQTSAPPMPTLAR